MNFLNKFKSYFLATAFLFLLVLLARCGFTNGNAVSPIRTYYGFQASVSTVAKWVWTLNYLNSTFSAQMDTGMDGIVEAQINGSLETLSNGYLKLTITASNGNPLEFPRDGTGVYYAIEVPGYFFFARPYNFGSAMNQQVISARAFDGCSGADSASNWVHTSYSPSGSSVSDGAFGTVVATTASGLTQRTFSPFDLNGSGTATFNDATWSCSAGQMAFSTGNHFGTHMSNLGGQIDNLSGLPNALFYAPQTTANTFSELGIDGDYIGFVTRPRVTGVPGQSDSITMTFASPGTGTGKKLLTPDASDVGPTAFSLYSFTVIQGLVKAFMDYPIIVQNGGKVGGVVLLTSPKKVFIFNTFQDNNPGYPATYFLVSKD